MNSMFIEGTDGSGSQFFLIRTAGKILGATPMTQILGSSFKPAAFAALATLLLFASSCCTRIPPKTSVPGSAEALYHRLAMTPPMGWNSWNVFQGKIDEEKIRGIADAMVASGMRDAGYEYLVLDDGWMADQRDSAGNLVPDPARFPSGMKALADYIHSKGLKFGIYEDRGHSTCMKLPGSFQHEQQDMNLFAQWGVDYLKLDSCYAEINGRLSTADYAVYRDCIIRSGRPMILSLANYTDPSWAWGGGQIGHLWRTSYDIGPSMGSVYYCADTTAGDIVIHPAFNGLWQFAGPGRWNDPDMLEVGNLPSDRENRTHFALWCILAAPLMAGNDLRSMTDSTRDVLIAEEVIKVDQDPRGVQGYKVYDDGDHEVYNKPLSDGTTAVLLLNKGDNNADITVSWDQIGLKGSQRVRDLWQRKDLAVYTDRFTARDLPQHDHRLLKIGTPGRSPLPMPRTVAPAKYMVIRKGKTYLSDLYYVWRSGEDAPPYNSNSEGRPIVIRGSPYARGLGFKGRCQAMFKLNGRAHKFHAVVGLDDACQGDDSCRFKVRNLDPIGPTSLLYDSGKMTRDTAPKTVDVDVTGVDCLILECESEKALGNWAEAQVLAD